MSLHHPPHVFLDETFHFVSASTCYREKLFHSSDSKEIIRDELRRFVAEFHLQLAAWVILDNHYHILVKSRRGQDLQKFLGRFHGRTSFELNQLHGTRRRQVWHNYWDTCIRNEGDYWVRFNYIHHNAIKHNYVSRMDDWDFSSYRFYLERKGAEWLADIWSQHPIIDFSDPRDA